MTTMKIATLRPGLLVSLKTSLTGGVTYQRRDLGQGTTEEGAHEAKWETERRIEDPEEHARGIKARSAARAKVTAVCSASAFGLLCPEADAEKLTAAVAEARAMAEEFNASAARTRIAVYVITGRVAADDVEAVRAIRSEVRDLISEMEEGIRRADVKAIRDAANRARDLSPMLAPDAARKVEAAIDDARAMARQLVKAGETAATVVNEATIARLASARTAFLDLEEPAAVAQPAAEQGRAVDLSPLPPAVVPEGAIVAADLEPAPVPTIAAPVAPAFEV